MTTITHGPDEQTRFDGMTVGELSVALDNRSARLRARGMGITPDMLATAAAALRHLSEWQTIETAPPDVDLLLGWMETFGHRRWVQAVAYAKHSNTCHPDSGASNAWSHGQATHWRPLPPGPMEDAP